jgi:peptidoglycan/xylan/chitin deacetylase (PgdA/CDA1 family)
LDAFAEIYADLLRYPDRWRLIRAELDKGAKFSDLHVDDELDDLRFTPLDITDLVAMREAGHQIGCHSWEHLPLGSLQPLALARDFQLCESKVGSYANTRLYSYPFGTDSREVSNDVAMECFKVGFEWAFLNTRAIAGLNCKPKYAVPRTSLPNTVDRYILEAKLSGFEAMLKHILGS